MPVFRSRCCHSSPEVLYCSPCGLRMPPHLVCMPYPCSGEVLAPSTFHTFDSTIVVVVLHAYGGYCMVIICCTDGMHIVCYLKVNCMQYQMYMCVFTVQSRSCLSKHQCLRSSLRLFASMLIARLSHPLLVPQVCSLWVHMFLHIGVYVRVVATKPVGVSKCCNTHALKGQA